MESLSDARVLVVDDDPEVLDAVSELIRGNGYAVESSLTGDGALSLLDSFQPHCVLFDVKMPGVDGKALSAQLRARYGDDVVLIAMTGYAGEQDVLDVLQVVDHYLVKPFDIERLEKVLPPL